MADNCTDDTAALAHAAGVEVFTSHGNTKKKAGALNQALVEILPGQGDNDLVMVMDADTTLDDGFLEAACRRMEDDRALMAVGGLFYGEDGQGLLGQFQRNEYTRYAREMKRRRGRVFVLTGTASLFRPRALRAVASHRGALLPGVRGDVYDTLALTEDNELTLALKCLGGLMISPGAVHGRDRGDAHLASAVGTTAPVAARRPGEPRRVRRAPADLPLLGPAARDRVRRPGALVVPGR